MNDNAFDENSFDRKARQTHAAALQALSPRVNAQLHNRLRSALAGKQARPAPARLRWGWAAAPALALVLAYGMPWPDTDTASPGDNATVAATLAPEPVVPALEQDPDFYLWLASADAVALASE